MSVPGPVDREPARSIPWSVFEAPVNGLIPEPGAHQLAFAGWRLSAVTTAFVRFSGFFRLDCPTPRIGTGHQVARLAGDMASLGLREGRDAFRYGRAGGSREAGERGDRAAFGGVASGVTGSEDVRATVLGRC